MNNELNWRVMGVDPGAKGAIATLDPVEFTLRVSSIPTRQFVRKSGRKVTQVDPVKLQRLVFVHGPGRAILEEVGTRPDEGAVSAFSFGQTFGTIRTVLELSEVPLELVTPATWKRQTKTPADKDGAVAWADKLFPECKAMWRGPRGGLQHDRAEAAIMALFGLVSKNAALTRPFVPIGD